MTFPFFMVRVAVVLAMVSTSLLAQSSSSTQQQQALLETYQKEQQALAQESDALLKQGATPAQLEALNKQQAARRAVQLERAQQLSALSQANAQPQPYVTDVEVPDGATQTMEDFLVLRAKIYNQQVAAQNQKLSAGLKSAEINKPVAIDPKDVAEQAALAKKLAEESSHELWPVPPPLNLPANATAPMKAYLTARDALMREQVELHNQYAASDLATQNKILEQWQQQNVARIEQISKLALAVSNQN